MNNTPRTNAASFLYFYGDVTEVVVTEEVAQELETELMQWRDVATKLAERLRSIPESGAARFPDARDLAALEEYDDLMRETT